MAEERMKVLRSVWEPCLDSGLRGDERPSTWQAQIALTDTERLVFWTMVARIRLSHLRA